MPTLRILLSGLAPLMPGIGLAWSLMVYAKGRRLPLLREEEMTDWPLRDIGWKDGPDRSARRGARMTERRWTLATSIQGRFNS